MTTETLTINPTLKELIEGNQRFVQGTPLHPHQSPTYRSQLVQSQSPHTAVLTCADSRVNPGIIFDQGLGDLFVLRVAGNIVNNMVLGSLEYAVEHFETRLIMVLGHSNCGAVGAAMAEVQVPGHIQSLVKPIKTAISKCSTNGHIPTIDEVVKENARRMAEKIRGSNPILSKKVKEGDLEVVPAIYHLESGEIELL